MPFIKQMYHAPVMFTGPEDTARSRIPHIKCSHAMVGNTLYTENNMLRVVQNEFGNVGCYMGTGSLLLSQETCVINCVGWANSVGNYVTANADYKLACAGTVSPSRACTVDIDSNKYRRQGMGALTTALETYSLITIPSTYMPSQWWSTSNWANSVTPKQFRISLRPIASAYHDYVGGKNTFYLLVDTFYICARSDSFPEHMFLVNYATYFKTALRNNAFLVGDTSCINVSTISELLGMPVTTNLRYGAWAIHACHSILHGFSTEELRNDSNAGYVYFSPVFGRPPGSIAASNTYLPAYIAMRMTLISTKESGPYAGSWA